MTKNEIEESIQANESQLNSLMIKYYKSARMSEKLTIITSVFAIITFTVIIAVTIINGIETNNTRRIDAMSSRIEQIENDNVYRDKVINQTRSEMNF